MLKKTDLKTWYADLVDSGDIVSVDVDGEPAYALGSEVEAIAGAEPFDGVRLLPAFDQYVLGPGTKDPQLIDAKRRGEISRAGGWISAVVIHRGRVAGVWESRDGVLDVTLFRERGDVPARGIEAEAKRISGGSVQVKISNG